VSPLEATEYEGEQSTGPHPRGVEKSQNHQDGDPPFRSVLPRRKKEMGPQKNREDDNLGVKPQNLRGCNGWNRGIGIRNMKESGVIRRRRRFRDRRHKQANIQAGDKKEEG